MDFKKHMILFVDDEPLTGKMFKLAFEDDFNIITATSAREGLELLHKHFENIGVIMTDQRMPSKDGIWLLNEAQLINPQIKRIMTTAYSDARPEDQCVRKLNLFKFLPKPWDMNQINDLLQQALTTFDYDLQQTTQTTN